MKYLKVASTYSLHTSQHNSGSKDFSQHRLRLARVKVIFQCRLQVKKIYFRLEIFTTKEDGLWSIFLVSSANICSYKVSAFFIKDTYVSVGLVLCCASLGLWPLVHFQHLNFKVWTKTQLSRAALPVSF